MRRGATGTVSFLLLRGEVGVPLAVLLFEFEVVGSVLWLAFNLVALGFLINHFDRFPS
jgi:uncharacterized integral membrane protein